MPKEKYQSRVENLQTQHIDMYTKTLSLESNQGHIVRESVLLLMRHTPFHVGRPYKSH